MYKEYLKVQLPNTLMTREENIILTRIIYPFNADGNKYTQYEAFERVKEHLNLTHFKTKQAQSLWIQLEALYKARMPFCIELMELDSLHGLMSLGSVTDITPHMRILKGGVS